MPKVDFEGIDELFEAFERIADIPDGVKREALSSMAKVAAEDIKNKGEAMHIRDDESSTHILDKITVKKPTLNPAGGYSDITFSGTRTRGGKRTRNAEIAFINEYGSDRQQARPFIGLAMTENADKITNQGADILGDWIEETFKK